MKKLIFTILIASLGFASCNNNKYKKEISKIDSLYIIIDSIEKTLSTIDTVNIRNIYKEYSENINEIKENFNDKKEDSVWSVITNYGVIKTPLKNYVNDFRGYYNEIKFSKKQLDDLKADIKDGNIKEEKISDYTKNETEAVIKLKELVEINVNGVKEKLKLFDSLNPKVIKIINNLKKNLKSEISKNKNI